jgi:hypothetical protein
MCYTDRKPLNYANLLDCSEAGASEFFVCLKFSSVSVKMLESNLRHGYNRTKEGLSAGGMAVNPKINWFIEAANSC